MADIDHFNIDGTAYDFRDSTARTTLQSKVDNTRTVNGHALSSNVTLTATDIGMNGSSLEDIIEDADARAYLLNDEIPNTTQNYTFDQSGAISTVTHVNSSHVTLRTDAFTFGDSTVTEVRTLNTGESLTITTDLDTLETTVVYTAS